MRLYVRNFNGKIYFRNVKLEVGEKETDLSATPEVVDSSIKVTTTNNKIARIETNLSSITSMVSST